MSATAERMTTAEVLRKALALLGPNGEYWVKEQKYGPCYCMVTAIQTAAGQSPNSPALNKIPAYEVLCKAAERDYGTLGTWNDHGKRTWPEVKAAFLRAIELAEASR